MGSPPKALGLVNSKRYDPQRSQGVLGPSMKGGGKPKGGATSSKAKASNGRDGMSRLGMPHKGFPLAKAINTRFPVATSKARTTQQPTRRVNATRAGIQRNQAQLGPGLRGFKGPKNPR